jgi:predicted nucleic acid-binding protein
VTLVIDASAALAWFFKDEANDSSDAILERVKKSGAAVPQISRMEIANGFRTAARRNRIARQDRDVAFARLAGLPIVEDTETADRARTSIVALSDRYDLTPYDAAYLELAIRLGADLATRDDALGKAAKSAGAFMVPC